MNINAGGSFLGNLMLGIYKGQEAQQHREDLLRSEELKNDLIKAQVKHYELQTKDAERKDASEARKEQLLVSLGLLQPKSTPPVEPQQLSGPDTPSATGPVFGPGFENQSTPGGGGNVTNMMARLQAMDPMQLAALKESGYDVVPGMNANRQEREFTWKQQQEDLKNWIRSQEIVLVPQQAPDGSVRQVPQFKNPAAAEVFSKKVQELNGGGSGIGPAAGGMPSGMPVTAPLMSTPPQLVGGTPSSIPKSETRKEVVDGKTYEFEVNPFNQQEVPGTRRVVEESKPMSGDAAGKIGMLQSGMDALKQARSLIMPNGDVDKETYKILAQASANLPWSKGRQYNSLILDTIEGKLRLESGAAVPDEEVKRIAIRFKPLLGDSPEQIKQKLERLERFAVGTVELLDPNKKYGKGVEKFKAEDGKQYIIKPDMKLDATKAADYLTKAKGDTNKARELAKADGWEF